MPFLRRRANVASETNMRQHAKEDSAEIPPVPRLSTTSINSNHDALSESPPEPAATSQNVASILRQRSRASNKSRPQTPSALDQASKHHRFSMLRFRNASDSQLSLRAKQHAETPPPVPQPPQIITTAPTGELPGPQKAPRKSLGVKLRFSSETPRESLRRSPSRKSNKSFNEEPGRASLATLDEPAALSASFQSSERPPPIPSATNRRSESSRSDAGSADRTSQGSPLSTPRRNPRSNNFLKFRMTKKPPAPFFDLSHLPRKDDKAPAVMSSTSLVHDGSPRPSSAHSARVHEPTKEKAVENSQPPNPAALLLTAGGVRSGQSSPTRTTTLLRGRSSTMSSTGRDSTDDHLMPPNIRTSTSTGRKSFSDLLGLSRLRQNSDLSRHGTFTPATPGSIASKSNSLQLTRESIPLPERREDESPAKYLARVEDVMARGYIGAALSKSADSFSAAVLRSFMRSFSFFGDPMDMSIRKLLMEAELPKETQHIDRFLQAFANRYHECNPGIFASTEQAYFIAFSLLILHTDVFNKNNKHKMQKSDYLKNTRGEGVCEEVLECFYDNISYTPFIHVEDEIDFGGARLQAEESKKMQLLVPAAQDPARRATKEPIDPYTLILDSNLDVLRPGLKESMYLEEHYNYCGTASGFNLKDLQKTFFRTGVLQIVSARSRPDAFMSTKTYTNPDESLPGIVDIKVTKVGLLWRKDPKKRKTRSPWQEWGAILTGAQLYFFRNVSWAKNLMHQYDIHIRQGNDGIPIIFKPPLEEFKPDALMSTHGAVALQDTNYKRHKNAFVYVREAGPGEVLLADNEEEMNDWLAKLNYAAAFRTSGVRMPGVGGGYDGHSKRGIRTMESSGPTQTVDTPTGPVSIVRSHIDKQMVEDIQAARRHVTRQKIEEAEHKLEDVQKQLDEQLRNARHLQILAPIQPKTREQLLVNAERIEENLRWTRMEMWKERCHRDILAQDMEEDESDSAYTSTPTKAKQAKSERPESPTQVRDAPRTTGPGKQSHKQSKDNYALGDIPSASGIAQDVELSLDKVFRNQPSDSASNFSESHSAPSTKYTQAPVENGATNGSRDALGLPTTPDHQEGEPLASAEAPFPARDERDQDEVDADERHFLQQAGLLDSDQIKNRVDKVTSSASAESGDHGLVNDRDRADKNKIRRSLHRTLRDGAGHLSHHRSKKGRDLSASNQGEEVLESQLSRGTGSFMVHGKKASVIRVGTDLKTMSQDETIMARKQAHPYETASTPPLSVEEEDDDFVSAVSVPISSRENGDRRASEASASTATARSFRELHRKYSTAQSRSTSGPGRLTIPSDGDSEVAVSISDGARSPLPPIETESDDEAEGDVTAVLVEDEGKDVGRVPDRGRKRDPSHSGSGDEDEEESTDGEDSDGFERVEMTQA